LWRCCDVCGEKDAVEECNRGMYHCCNEKYAVTVSSEMLVQKKVVVVSLEQTAEGKRVSLTFPSAREGDGPV
jgi:hypothetical protein